MTITAKSVLSSVSPDGVRIDTLLLRYPRFIHSEFMTHRQFSRNASSSRAIPVERLIADVERDPAMPIFWGRNTPPLPPIVPIAEVPLDTAFPYAPTVIPE